MSYTNYATAYPDGGGDESYSNLNDSTISGLTTQMDGALSIMSADYINIYGGIDQYNAPYGILANRNDSNDISNYEGFYPNSQQMTMFQISQYNAQTDGSDYQICVNNPSALAFGNVCLLFSPSSNYSFDVPSI